MIDFVNPEYIKLGSISDQRASEAVRGILIEGEKLVAGFKTLRDEVIFSTKRIIAINIQGVTGKKRSYTSLPYTRIQAFAIETASTFDLDSRLDIWISTVGKIHFEIEGSYDIKQLNRVISEYII